MNPLVKIWLIGMLPAFVIMFVGAAAEFHYVKLMQIKPIHDTVVNFSNDDETVKATLFMLLIAVVWPLAITLVLIVLAGHVVFELVGAVVRRATAAKRLAKALKDAK